MSETDLWLQPRSEVAHITDMFRIFVYIVSSEVRVVRFQKEENTFFLLCQISARFTGQGIVLIQSFGGTDYTTWRSKREGLV